MQGLSPSLFFFKHTSTHFISPFLTSLFVSHILVDLSADSVIYSLTAYTDSNHSSLPPPQSPDLLLNKSSLILI